MWKIVIRLSWSLVKHKASTILLHQIEPSRLAEMPHVLLVLLLQADALVGVCRDLDQNCSKTITFDLSRFEPPSEAA
jgi:hypothetical protein